MSDQTVWILFFEDADRRPEFFSGEGAEWAAHERFKQASASWACHLCVNEARLTAAETRIKELESIATKFSSRTLHTSACTRLGTAKQPCSCGLGQLRAELDKLKGKS